MDILAKAVEVYYTESQKKMAEPQEITIQMATQVLALASGPYRGSLNAIQLDSVRDTAIPVHKNMDAIRMSMQRHVKRRYHGLFE